MKILVPIAGKSPFFPESDYPFTKPLIEVSGKTMIERVIHNIQSIGVEVEFIFVIMREDMTKFSLDRTLRLLTDGNCELVVLKGETRGALCSCLMAISHLDENEELVIANGDQIISADLSNAISYMREHDAEGGVITFPSVHPRWSYVKEGEKGEIVQAEEKKVISRQAIAGFYYFSKGKYFIDAAKASILANRSVNNNFFIAPSLNELVLSGKKVVQYGISGDQYHSLYSPSKITEYEDYLLTKAMQRSDHPKTSQRAINIVIPAAGMGSRFSKAGYEKPKPFISVKDRTMIEQVITNVFVKNARTTLLLRSDHLEAESELAHKFLSDGCQIVEVEKLTEGTACTVLLARQHIDNNNPLLIANSDQLVDFDSQAFIDDALSRELDGSILVFRDHEKNPKWSFAKVNDSGLVTEVAEKKPISDLATVGIYFFARGADFVRAALDMIVLNDRVNNEFYTCPVYNYMIRQGLRVGTYEIPRNAMHGLGTPEDLDEFLKLQGGVA